MRELALSVLAYIVYHLLYFTWRVKIYEPKDLQLQISNKKAFVLAAWHGNELALLPLCRHYKMAALVSESKDGQIMSNLLGFMGTKTVRGSSSRGAIGGLKALLRLLKSGRVASFAVDGPRGPYRKIKPGVFEVSRMVNLPIHACGLACSSYWVFRKSWNKAILPKPFSKIVIVWSEAFGPITRDQDPRSLDLSKDLNRLMLDAERIALTNLARS